MAVKDKGKEKEYSQEEVSIVLSKTVVKVLFETPFYGHILTQMKKIVSTVVPTLGVKMDRTVVMLEVNGQFFMLLTEEQKKEVLKHEILHVVLLHVLREKKYRFTEIFNYAADMVVNQLINASCLPGAILPEVFGLPKGLALDEYYNKLLQRVAKELGINDTNCISNDLEKKINEKLKQLAKDAHIIDVHDFVDEGADE